MLCCCATLAAPKTPTALELLDWAETAYPTYFPGRPATATAAPYLYRYYAQNGNYLGVAGSGIWLLGPVVGSNTTPKYVGELAAFSCQVNAFSCATPTSFPERPLTLVVPFAAGGPTDTLARALATALQSQLGATVTVSNRLGSGGTLGADNVANAAADGTTLLFTNLSMATAPTLYRQLPYSPLLDFEFLGMTSEMPMVVNGRNSLPPSSYAQLLLWLRTSTPAPKLAHGGLGSAGYVCALLLQQAWGIKLEFIAYAGVAPALTDLIGGSTDTLCNEVVDVQPQVTAKTIKSFAVTSDKRLANPVFAALPTVAEQGAAGFLIRNWQALYAPKGTPAPVLDKLNAALRAALQDPTLRNRFTALGAVLVDDERLAPASHRRFLDLEMQRLAPLLRAAGQYAD